MYEYNIYEWIAFFIIYCFIGWVGESIYVSLECKKWVNRGFMNGPFLPIYGFGAIIMLFAALPVRNNLFLIFLFGMIAATALEYFTGWALEKIFKARYWDYTYEPFNIQGYICLGCSITWGVCAMLLLRLLHPFVEKIVIGMNHTAMQVLDYIFIGYFAFDIFISVRQALDLRKIITEYIEHSEEIKRIQKRIDVIIAVINDDRENAKEELEKLKAAIEEKREAFRQKTERFQPRAFKVFKRNPRANNRKHLINMETLKRYFNN